jgi:hypothetical protein
MDTGLCDGCGQPATPQHIARRLRRLELATRFRPIHIGMLFLAEAPPARVEDYFYSYDAAGAAERSRPSRVFLESLFEGVGISREEGKSDEACLGEFQRRGFFLADALECPWEEIKSGPGAEAEQSGGFELWQRIAPILVKRIQFSYKPRHMVLLSARMRHLIPVLQQAGLGERLLLHQGLPLDLSGAQNPIAQAQFRAGLAAILAAAARSESS